jgi:hypothetical protein
VLEALEQESTCTVQSTSTAGTDFSEAGCMVSSICCFCLRVKRATLSTLKTRTPSLVESPMISSKSKSFRLNGPWTPAHLL